MLTSYPVSNLNRDNNNSPKTCNIGGTERLRISSQCLKSAWRNSWDESQIGIRTKDIFQYIFDRLTVSNKIDKLNELFVKKQKKGDEKPEKIEDFAKHADTKSYFDQITFYSKEEMSHIDFIINNINNNQQYDKNIFINSNSNVGDTLDLMLWGRLVTSDKQHSVEGVCQVAHAFTTNACQVEEDFFTAVDSLNKSGSAHLGTKEFSSGVYYSYVNINKKELVKKIQQSNKDFTPEQCNVKANDLINTVIETITQVSPTGNKSSMAHQTSASYVLVESGNKQPCNYAVAFLNPIQDNYFVNSINAIKSHRDTQYKFYGDNKYSVLDMINNTGNIQSIKTFISND